MIGADHGLSDSLLQSLSGRTQEIHRKLADLNRQGDVGFFDLHSINTLPIKKFAAAIREKYENLIVLGIGGSALGTSAVYGAVRHGFTNLLTKRKRDGYPRLFVADNIDPDHFDELLRVTDPKKTFYCVISKSGTTAETMAQFMIVHKMLKQKLNGKWKKRVVVITDASKGALRSIAEENGLKYF